MMLEVTLAPLPRAVQRSIHDTQSEDLTDAAECDAVASICDTANIIEGRMLAANERSPAKMAGLQRMRLASSAKLPSPRGGSAGENVAIDAYDRVDTAIPLGVGQAATGREYFACAGFVAGSVLADFRYSRASGRSKAAHQHRAATVIGWEALSVQVQAVVS